MTDYETAALLLEHADGDVAEAIATALELEAACRAASQPGEADDYRAGAEYLAAYRDGYAARPTLATTARGFDTCITNPPLRREA